MNWFKSNSHYVIGMVILLITFFYIFSNLIFDTSQDSRIEEAQIIRRKSGEISLQEFNKNIYRDMEFSGVIENHDYDRSIDETKTFSIRQLTQRTTGRRWPDTAAQLW